MYRKLGIGSRAELTRFVASGDIDDTSNGAEGSGQV
jgi:hypothetical protein